MVNFFFNKNDKDKIACWMNNNKTVVCTHTSAGEIMAALYRVFCCAIQYYLIHLALCVIFFPARVTCDDEEERASRKVLRGCSRSPSCTGCMKCVCFGCETCRFVDCDCQTCVDFYRNSKE